jgi:hypothetical protein
VTDGIATRQRSTLGHPERVWIGDGPKTAQRRFEQ